MSTSEVVEQFDKLPAEQQKEVFILIAKKIAAKQGSDMQPWLGKKLSFEEACNVVFRENRELIELIAK